MVTLATTTLLVQAVVTDSAVQVASTAGITPGLRLYIDQELMAVVSLGIGTSVNVLRGVDGTATAAHASSATVTIGRADQFYTQDPIGPPLIVEVTPWINVVTGTQWTPQGDTTGPNASAQWWAKMETTHAVGALGVRTAVSAASEVTNS